MKKTGILVLLLGVTGCASWPAGSYVQMQDDRDATALAAPVVNQIVAATEPGQTVQLLPPAPGDNMLTAFIQADLRRQGVRLVDAGGTHKVQYIASPLGGGELLRVCIDGKRGGAEYFTRNAAGGLEAGGPFMEVQP